MGGYSTVTIKSWGLENGLKYLNLTNLLVMKLVGKLTKNLWYAVSVKYKMANKKYRKFSLQLELELYMCMGA